MKTRFALFLALFASLIWSAARAGDAAAETKAGYKLYRQKKYVQAKAAFEKAIEDDPQQAGAHLGLARSLTALRGAGQTCAQRALKSVIMRHLFKAVRLNPRLKRRILRDKSLRPVHDTFAFQRLLKRTPQTTAQVEKILRAVSWHGPATGPGGPQATIHFAGRGRVSYRTMEGGQKKDHPGTYQVHRSRIIVRLNEALGEVQEINGELKQTGELWLPGLPGPFTDDPHECEQTGDPAP